MTKSTESAPVEVKPCAIYIAARFSRRPECNALANALQERGHVITSRWVKPDIDHVLPTGLSRQAEDSERRRFAIEDMEDVRACDMMVSLMEEPRSNGRGGRHVEYGAALALGKRLVIIGPRETVFHHLPEVEHFDSVDEFLAAGPWNTRASLTPVAEPATAASEDIARVERVETVPIDHPFSDEQTPPIWRVAVGEYVADFDFEQAARNFAGAINSRATPTTAAADTGSGDGLPWANVGELAAWIEKTRWDAFRNGARHDEISAVEATVLLSKLAALSQFATTDTYAGWQQRRGRLPDLIEEAVTIFDDWMLDDSYDARGCLDRVIAKLRSARDFYPATTDTPEVPADKPEDADPSNLRKAQSASCEDADAGLREAVPVEKCAILPPDSEDLRLILKAELPRCPCCEGTPTTFARYFSHSGIYQAYVHCSWCDVQVFKNARDLEAARELAIATWSKRPTARAALQHHEAGR